MTIRTPTTRTPMTIRTGIIRESPSKRHCGAGGRVAPIEVAAVLPPGLGGGPIGLGRCHAGFGGTPDDPDSSPPSAKVIRVVANAPNPAWSGLIHQCDAGSRLTLVTTVTCARLRGVNVTDCS